MRLDEIMKRGSSLGYLNEINAIKYVIDDSIEIGVWLLIRMKIYKGVNNVMVLLEAVNNEIRRA